MPAHKNILCARSPVFAAMFLSPMKESVTNEVDIVDISPSVLRDMLTFIYTGKSRNMTVSSAGDLLFVAEKYQIQYLKTVCCSYMKSNISVENAMKIFMLGDMYDQDLKVFALQFICTKFNEFSDLEQLEDWKLLLKEKHSLAVELLISLIKARDKKIKGYKKIQTLSVMGLI
ncbi:speckle-type POZ protein B-like [Argiope bruennichi]|uniref:speckle-type POZ protein B-like n=1 Tax=Argiope bruennichi TaxID=94029 RepID=UPI002494CDAC|nr:speckle-type POZ protein B-like [Argiope bruennichi]